MIKIALIIGSTRPNRFADVPAQWILDGANSRADFAIETLDLRDHPLPYFEEPISPAASGGVFSNPAAEAWRHKIGGYDGFIILTAEYNHGPTAVLKNALDYAFLEWQNKPIGFVGYGGVGAARAVEQLRLNAIELQMAPIRNAVHIGIEPYLGVLQQNRTLDSYDYLNRSRDALFDQLVWWARALKAGRAQLASVG
jgi:NAD(P)H-dependent FMN reductase